MELAASSNAASSPALLQLADLQEAWCAACSNKYDAARVKAYFKPPDIHISHGAEGWPVGALFKESMKIAGNTLIESHPYASLCV